LNPDGVTGASNASTVRVPEHGALFLLEYLKRAVY
jgi:hypothetical protein